ncbi:BglG family transcription antiterminator [Candidatus Enterococcus ferrettii]|uniref:PTS system EIIA component n=1 Tax=Candidatus Enterococcus ferrettii TaxID=2815324 RepID=A0ABV0EP01_9ENTE|nr:PRD domain-containing protein [Enterococcus sp. 665A]MBO1340664.1 PTS sugar transporter subunit IIA [Enterococcus sp. 665A]
MNERQIKLARLLIEHDEFLPASFYSKKLSVSTKTVFQDLETLRLFIQPYYVEIERLPSLGIRLSGEHHAKANFLKELENELSQDQLSPINRRVKIIKSVFFEEDNPTLESLAEQYLVSKTSLYNDLKIMNEIIVSNNIEITSNNDGLISQGQENDIQSAAKQLVAHFSNLCEENSINRKLYHFFSKQLVDIVSKVLHKNFRELTENVSDYYMESLLTTLLVQCRRLKIGFHVEGEADYLFSSIRYMETFVVANEMSEELSQETGLIFSEADKEYLSRQLFAHRVTTEVKASDETYVDLVHRLISRMSKIEKVDLTQDEHLFNSLIYHVPAMILRLKRGIHIENPLLESIRDQYSELFSIVWYALVIVEQQYDVILNDDEISFILIHFQIALDRQSKANNIIIVCQYGMSSAQFIFSKVRKFIPAHDNVEISTMERFNKSDKENIDLIISSIDIPQSKVPFVKVTPLVSDQDYIKIMEAYTKYLIQGELFGISASLEHAFEAEVLNKYISPQLINLQNFFSDKADCLNNMIDELEKCRLVLPSFRKSIFDREDIGNTNLDSGVALPHADPTTILKSHIYIVSLKKAINWGDRTVKLIIMVNLSEEDLPEIREVVEELYQFIDEKKKVDTLVKIKDSSQMLQIFSIGGN